MPKQSSNKPGVRKYVPRTEKDVDEHANQSGGQFDSIFKQGVDTWTPKMGDNTIRFLEPTWDEHRYYGYEIFVHNRVGADNSTYLCLNKMKRKACPICEAMLEAKRAGENDDAKKLAPQKRFVSWILDRNERDQNPQIYSMPWTNDRDIAALCKDKRTGKIVLIDHPYEGYDVSFSRKAGPGGIKLDSGFQIDRESTALIDDDTKLEGIREYITENTVPDQLKFYSYEHLQQVIKGTTEDKDEELDENNDTEDERPRSPAKPSRARPRRDDDDDDEPQRPRSSSDNDEDEPRKPSRSDDDDNEVEQPAKPSRARSRNDDDETVDDDDKPQRQRSRRHDEAEEDEKPRKPSRRSDDEDERPAPPKRSSRDDDDGDDEAEEARPSKVSRRR